MSGERLAAERAAGKSREVGVAWASRVEAAKQSRGLTTGLGGTCVAVFTFLLFFLYPRLVAGEVDLNLFRLTVLAIVGSLYLLIFSALFYFFFTQTLGRDDERARAYLDRADGFFAVALVFLVAAPALILFTINLPDLGSVALALWVVYLVLFLRGTIGIARAGRGHADAR